MGLRSWLFGKKESKKTEILHHNENSTNSDISIVPDNDPEELYKKQHTHYLSQPYDNNIDYFLKNRESIKFYGQFPISELVDGIHKHFYGIFINIIEDPSKADAFYIWGNRYTHQSLETMLLASKYNKPLFFLEDGFIRSIYSYLFDVASDYKAGISFTVDSLGFYYNANKETNLELLLNNYVVDKNGLERARNCITKLLKNKISKYNYQSNDVPEKYQNSNQILIIDQSYNDAAIVFGAASQDSFLHMVKDAVNENPTSKILIKTHPDNIATNSSGYFSSIDNIEIIQESINPLALFDYVEKVYVATSQLGFEALMAGKEVHTYGLPFYAGWGLTVDKQKTVRRRRKLTLEEFFYITYIVYSHYVNPDKGTLCEIEEAIDYMIKLRDQISRL